MINELIMMAIGGGIVGTLHKVYHSIKSKKSKQNIQTMNDPESYPYLHKNKFISQYACPKCNYDGHKNNIGQLALKLCDCMEFPRYHFHFECQNCIFKCIMRTADDKG